MQIIRDKFYLIKLEEIIEYMASGSIVSATKFLDKLDSRIDKLAYMPYKFRRSYYYEDEDIRDLTFKGFTIPYLVDMDNEVIVVLDIFKWNYRKVMAK